MVPNPNSPSLDDIEYAYFSAAAPVGLLVAQGLTVNENIALDFVGYTYKVNTSDFLSVNVGLQATNIQLAVANPGPEAWIIYLGDTVTTTEFINTESIGLSDTVTTAESLTVVRI